MLSIGDFLKKKPLTHDGLMTRFSIIRTVLALGIGIFVAVIVILLTSDQPGLCIKYLLLGPVFDLRYFERLIVMWIPIVFTGLAVCLMFSAKYFNLFAEGAFFSGALVGAILAVSFDLPGFLLPVVCILAAIIAGGVLGAVPAILQYKLKANIMVSTMMFNFICLNVGVYLVSYYFRDIKAGQIVTEKFPSTARLPEIIRGSGVHIGLIIAIIMVVLVYFYMYHTRWGYELRITGKSEKFAKYAGVRIGFVTIFTQVLACAIAAGGGAVEMLGVYERFSWSSLPGQGWDGVTLAIIANNNPKYIPLAAFFIAYLREGADLMSMKTGMETNVVSIVQAVILVFLLAGNLLSAYKNRQIYKLSKDYEEKVNSFKGGEEIG